MAERRLDPGYGVAGYPATLFHLLELGEHRFPIRLSPHLHINPSECRDPVRTVSGKHQIELRERLSEHPFFGVRVSQMEPTRARRGVHGQPVLHLSDGIVIPTGLVVDDAESSIDIERKGIEVSSDLHLSNRSVPIAHQTEVATIFLMRGGV